jgi:hypothetical protein
MRQSDKNYIPIRKLKAPAGRVFHAILRDVFKTCGDFQLVKWCSFVKQGLHGESGGVMGCRLGIRG